MRISSWSAAAHSETGPATTVPDAEEMGKPVTTVTNGRTGGQLAEGLLQGVGNKGMRAAAILF
ncbi:hypothetical protein [Streptomyces sp. NPDC004728]|uniref:hypothetical protein n=1 Tax=Streptomyces sp. NPDC004728 TaxID=3154289 RepID=UPI0033A1BC10